jgi:hypothetical protein
MTFGTRQRWTHSFIGGAQRLKGMNGPWQMSRFTKRTDYAIAAERNENVVCGKSSTYSKVRSRLLCRLQSKYGEIFRKGHFFVTDLNP